MIPKAAANEGICACDSYSQAKKNGRTMALLQTGEWNPSIRARESLVRERIRYVVPDFDFGAITPCDSAVLGLSVDDQLQALESVG